MSKKLDDATIAKLLLVLCGTCWGLMWPRPGVLRW
jgi:hypothetical protein